MFTITVCATTGFTKALTAQARRVQAACRHIPKGTMVIVGDECKDLDVTANLYKELMPQWDVKLIKHKNLKVGPKAYDEQPQLLIAQLRTSAFSYARSIGTTQCLSLDSDVLIPENSVRCMQTMLEFDNGYYSIATCPYPSQGGGGFLAGRGTPQRQILPDFYTDELNVPEDVLKTFKAMQEEVNNFKEKGSKEFEEKVKALQKFEEDLKKYGPKGNVWALNAVQWRRRGWMEQAYPAIGKGAIIPTDWVGFGCTMMNSRALDLVDFCKYQAKGTEDIAVVWNYWYPAGLKLCSIPHCLCDHVIRDRNNPKNPDKLILCNAYHETEGEMVGHVRVRHQPFFSYDCGEIYNSENDGKMYREPLKQEPESPKTAKEEASVKPS